MRQSRLLSFGLLCVAFYLGGCTGTQTFGTAARPGDTIAIASGWNQDLERTDISVQITDSGGIPTAPVPPRAVINAYPDPLSNMIIESYTDIGGGPESGIFWAPQVDDNITNGDKDYSQQILFVDLPLTLNPGTAQISISGPGLTPDPIDIEILPLAAGTGTPHTFGIQETLTGSTLGVSIGTRLRLAERAPHNTVTFTGTTVPHAIEVTLTHDPDFFGGASTGVTYVTSPRSDIKNIAWSDNGTELKVIMTPSRLAPIVSVTDLVDFKFYVAGGITGLTGGIVKAYDIDGNSVSGVSCEIDGVAC